MYLKMSVLQKISIIKQKEKWLAVDIKYICALVFTHKDILTNLSLEYSPDELD